MSTKLPTPLTRFIGREAELARAAELLREFRLLTLTGPGGAGKTRLALCLATSVSEQFPDGVWFVDFSPLSSGEFVWDRLASTLGLRETQGGTARVEAMGRSLAQRKTLLILDNCEHVVQSAAEVAAGLLEAAQTLKIVATSREPLGVDGEVTWTVPPMNDEDAVDLFMDRARQARPQITLRDKDTDAARTICRRLDGMPLAIELAAARARSLELPYIAAGLTDRLALLPSGPRTAPQRQSTLAASFEWSHELLPEAERALLRQLSVFAGGFDVEAALAVCPAASLERLAALADRSLIMLETRADQVSLRYRMLAPVREFAAEHLDEAGEVELVRSRHRDHYQAMAESGFQLVGDEKSQWLDCMRTEQDNVRAAMAWSRDRGEAEALIRMLVPLTQAWGGRARWIEVRMWLAAAAEQAGEVSPRWRAWIRLLQIFVPFVSGGSAFDEMPQLASEGLALARAGGDEVAEAFFVSLYGFMAGLSGGAEAMRPYLEQTLPHFRSATYIPLGSMLLDVFVLLRWFQSDPEEPGRLIQEAISLARFSGDRHFAISAVLIAGMTALIGGRLAEAARLFDSAVDDSRHDNDDLLWMALLGRAWVAVFAGDFAAARAGVSESLAASRGTDPAEASATMVGPTARLILASIDLAVGDAAGARHTFAKLADGARASPLARWTSVPLVFLASAQLALGAIGEATASLDEAVTLARAGAMTWVLGRASFVRARLRAAEAALHDAESLGHEALGLAREAGDQMGLVDTIELLARLAAEQASAKEAVRLWAAADSLRSTLGYARFPGEQGAYETAVAAAKRAIGQDQFSAVWSEGAKLSAEEAIAYAARGRGERKRPSAGWASLTPSELEVARLVGEHLSNPEIAKRLFVSRATVKTHLLHIFAKLGIDSRSELAAAAIGRRDHKPKPVRAT